MKTQFLILMGIFLLCFHDCLAEVKTYKCGDDCTATLDENGVMTVSGTGTMYGYNSTTRYETPWFNDASHIKSVVVKEGIENVGTWAFFACGGIKKIELAPSVLEVSDAAFDEIYHGVDITVSDTTIWQDQDNFSQFQNATIHCRGVLSQCEENLMKNQSKTVGADVVAQYGKRIYTIDEANAASGKKNKVKIRYK